MQTSPQGHGTIDLGILITACRSYLRRIEGYSHVILGTDSAKVVNLWNSRHGSQTVVAHIQLEIRELTSLFTSCIIQHVSRTANFPANLCANRACSLMVIESWLDSEPPFLITFTSLMADCPMSTFV